MSLWSKSLAAGGGSYPYDIPCTIGIVGDTSSPLGSPPPGDSPRGLDLGLHVSATHQAGLIESTLRQVDVIRAYGYGIS